MNNKKLAIFIALMVFIVAVIVFAFLNNKKLIFTSKNNVSKTKVSANVNNNTTISAENGGVTVPEGVDASTMAPLIPVALSVMPESPDAPKQVITDIKEIPANTIKLSVSDAGFSPKEFTVSAGQKVSLAITPVGNNTHVFIFPNASLMALTMMVSSGETKVINFVAPSAGSYTFRDDIPSFRNNTGTMIVK